MRRILLIVTGALLAFPAMAMAADAPPPDTHLVFPTDQVWAIVAASIVPLLAYAINYFAPWVSEPIKGLVFAVAGAIAAGVTQAITAGNVGFNNTTLQFIVTGIVAAIGSHAFWTKSQIAPKFGAGANKQDAPAGP